MSAEPLKPRSIRREGDGLIIDWEDGHRGVLPFRHLRANCPCASCNEERAKPPDPFRVLSAREAAAGPPQPVAMPRRGYYAYQIVWNDGHDAGIYTLERLRELCQCPECAARSTV